MNLKFKLTDETKINFLGKKLFRIEATADFGSVKKGDKGGWVESERLSNGNARVFGNAWVSGDAEVSGDAWVSGDAEVSGNARVFGDAEVSGNARVFGNAWVFGNAEVSGNARVFGNAEVSGNARVFGNALSIKADVWEILLHAIPEIPALRQAVIDGKVDGSVYEGECACLCGTIANVRKCDYKELEGIEPDSQRPAEAYFMGISKGDTPETNPIAKEVLGWIDELMVLLGIEKK